MDWFISGNSFHPLQLGQPHDLPAGRTHNMRDDNISAPAMYTAPNNPKTPRNSSHLPEELLEAILLLLPPKDLLLSQRTSRHFRHTVLGSPRIQKTLFLAPDWHPPSHAAGLLLQRPENNRLLLRAFPGCYPTIHLIVEDTGAARNPLHSSSHSSSHPSHPSSRSLQHHSWELCISFPATTPPPTTHPSVLYPEASWRRMFLSQPPCRELHLVRRWQRSEKAAMVCPEGIRMGEFVGRAGRKEGDVGTGGGWEGANGGVGADAAWDQRFVSSDRDWHFEGSISVSSDGDVGVGEVLGGRTRIARERGQGYLFSRSSRSGVVRAEGDDWDPGRVSGFVQLAHL